MIYVYRYIRWKAMADIGYYLGCPPLKQFLNWNFCDTPKISENFDFPENFGTFEKFRIFEKRLILIHRHPLFSF